MEVTEGEKETLQRSQRVVHIQYVLLLIELSHLQSLGILLPRRHDEIVSRSDSLDVPAVFKVKSVPSRPFHFGRSCCIHIKGAANF